jgi:mannose-1-phosphate guanylyltransferase
MHVIILADEIGPKLWPVTSEELPKAFLPVYSELSLLEETLARLSAVVEGQGDRFIIVTTGKSIDSLIKQNTLNLYGIPVSNVLTLPAQKGSAWAIWEAVRYLIDIKEVPSDEPIIVSPSDQFLWPTELAMFHFLNIATRLRTHPDEWVAVCLNPGGPSPGMNYFFGDWQQVTTMGIPYEDTVLGTISTLNVAMEGYQITPDLDSAKELVANNWMWDLGTYGASLRSFDHYLREALQVKGSQIMGWNKLEVTPFSFVVPSILTDRKLRGALIPKIAWSTLDNWVSIKHLLYDSGLFQPEGQAGVHSIESTSNLIFKPPGKTIALYGVSNLVIIDTGDKLLIGTPEGLNEYF